MFAGEFAAARETVARALAVRIAPGAGVARRRRGRLSARAADGARRASIPATCSRARSAASGSRCTRPPRRSGDVRARRRRGRVRARPTASASASQLAALPALACVADDADYYASFDAERYQRADRTESLGALKQSVARKVAAGRQAEAVAEVDALSRERKRAEQLRALGYFDGEHVARARRSCAAQVSAPAAASPEAQQPARQGAAPERPRRPARGRQDRTTHQENRP